MIKLNPITATTIINVVNNTLNSNLHNKTYVNLEDSVIIDIRIIRMLV